MSTQPEPTPAAETIFAEFQEQGPLVGILIGSESDREAIEPAVEELSARGISNELRVLSAHRDPAAWPSTRPPRPCGACA